MIHWVILGGVALLAVVVLLVGIIFYVIKTLSDDEDY